MEKVAVKIILVATDVKKKSLVFVDENLRVYSLQEAIKSAQDGLFKNIYTVNRSGNFYLRSTPSTMSGDKLDHISISSYKLFYSLNDLGKILSVSAFKNYWQKYQQNLLQEQQGKRDACIIIDGHLRIAKATAQYQIKINKDIIFAAVEKFNIDPYLLAAILIDEIARFGLFEEIVDKLLVYVIGKNTSIGIGQVTTDTAKGLMVNGYHNPDPKIFSSKEKINGATRQQIYEYIKEPRHNIFFAAAQMRYFIDRWAKFTDLSKKPEIIATLYSLPKDNPKSDPQPNERGLQIANEFYNLAKLWLK